jgi:addiction module RelE/StbE family toxin
MVIIFSKNFTREYEKLSKSLQNKFKTRFTIFQKDIYNPLLKNHTLQGKWGGNRSINITGDIRAIYREENELIIFIAIGSHSDLYK